MSHAGHGHGHAAMLHAVMQVRSVERALCGIDNSAYARFGHARGVRETGSDPSSRQLDPHSTRPARASAAHVRAPAEAVLPTPRSSHSRTSHIREAQHAPPAPHTSRAKRECGTWCARDGCLCAPPERHGRSPAHCTASVSQRSDEKSVLEQSWMREKPNCSARDENSGIVRLSLSPNGS